MENIKLPKEEVAEEEVKLDLPKSDSPVFVYDKDKRTFWVGIPVERCVPLEAFAILDSMKMTYLQCFMQLANELKNPKIITPGALNKARDFFLRKSKKA